MPRKNPEAHREYCRQWRAANKEKTAAYSHKHRHERRERDRARMAVNPLIRHLDNVNRHAQACGRKGRITWAEFTALVEATHGICPGCKRPFGEGGARMTFDHVVPTSAGGEHSAANGQIICFTCR